MTFSLTGNFFLNARGVTFTDGGGVTWSFNSNTNSITAAASGGGGGLTSVGFSDASSTPIYTVANSPLTANGTLTITLNTQTANTVFAGPTTGSAAQPGFRALVIADIPTISAAHTSGFATVATSGAYSDLSGTPTVPTAANPTAAVSTSAVNGSASTFMRSDAAPVIDLTMTATWTGLHAFTKAGEALKIVGDTSFGNVRNTAGTSVLQWGTDKAVTGTGSDVTDAALLSIAAMNFYTNSSTTRQAQLTTSGLTVGAAPTGGGQGTGTINISGTFYSQGTAIGSLTDASTTPIYNTGGAGTSTVALTHTLKTQNANTVFAGPASGAAAQPAFRSLVAADGGIAGFGTVITTLTQAGGASQVYSIPAAATTIQVICLGGGGGGGSGQKPASGTTGGGGGGGAGGGMSQATFRAADLGSSVTVAFSNASTGGNGGAGVTGNSVANGQNGVLGSSVNFGTLLWAYGGGGGVGGVGGSGTGGSATGTGLQALGTAGGLGGTGTGGNGTAQGAGTFGINSYSNTGGGGGGGLPAIPAASAGGNGGSSPVSGQFITLTGGLGGTAGNPGNPGSANSGTQPSSGGGGGSSGASTNSGQAGGHGGDFGGGGGGGGACLTTGTTTGAGGRGGFAACIIIAY